MVSRTGGKCDEGQDQVRWVKWCPCLKLCPHPHNLWKWSVLLRMQLSLEFWQFIPKCNHDSPYKREADSLETDAQRRLHENRAQKCTARQGMLPSTRHSMAARSWKRTGTHSSAEPLERMGPCYHLDFGLLTSKTLREYMFLILNYQVCENLLHQLQEMNPLGSTPIAKVRPSNGKIGMEKASWWRL